MTKSTWRICCTHELKCMHHIFMSMGLICSSWNTIIDGLKFCWVSASLLISGKLLLKEQVHKM